MIGNIGHVPAHVGTHHRKQLQPVLARSTGNKLLVWGSVMRVWFERSRQRRELAELDDRLLRDIGVTRAQARHEAEKPFWSASRA